MSKKVRLAIVGVGNCASSLVQGIYYYKEKGLNNVEGIMFSDIGGYKPFDIEIVAAWDIDERKVGKDVSEAIFSLPNCTTIFYRDVPKLGVKVRKGKILDGVANHMKNFSQDKTFVISSKKDDELEDVVAVLKDVGADVLINYVPVGSEMAARFYAEACLKAGVAFVNAMPTFIVSDPLWGEKFEKEGIPAVGDDIKSQLGATILHRTLIQLFVDRGIPIRRSLST
jgi:Myo-inositol-1-phosphate synthase